MQYYLCPRCQFKVSARKYVCATCGYNMAVAKEKAEETELPANSRGNVWSRFLGLERRKESTTEKPALS